MYFRKGFLNILRHNCTETVYLSDLLSGCRHYFVYAAEFFAQKLCGRRADISYSKTENYTVKRIIF